MAKIALQKIRISGLKKHYKILMQELHRSGMLQVIKNQNFIKSSLEENVEHFGVFNLARIEFAINFLSKYESKKSKIDLLLSGGKLVLTEDESKERLNKFVGQHEAVIDECEKIEEQLVKNSNELGKLPAKKSVLKSFKNLDLDIQVNYSSEMTETWIGKIDLSKKDAFLAGISKKSNLVDIEIVSEDSVACFLRITALKTVKINDVLNNFQFEKINLATDFPEFIGQTARKGLSELEAKTIELEADQNKLNQRAKELAQYVDDLKIMFDYNAWRKTKNDLQHDIFRSKTIFAFEAWIPKRDVVKLINWIDNAFVNEVFLEEVVNEKEIEPTFIENVVGISSFEPVVKMYSLPSKVDVDPTRFIAFFFTIFFGFCLSDVGYGALLTIISAWFLFFGNFSSEAKRTILLLVICGISAMIGGVLLGGYFGMTAEQAPAFLTYNGKFIGQFINPIGEPIKLLTVALIFGGIQLQTGTLIQFFNDLNHGRIKDAIAGPGLWFVFVCAIVLFAMTEQLGLNPDVTKYTLIASAVIFILAQGKNPLLGIYVLYDKISGFLSNFLSYARLMALAIATGVVASTMNQIALTFYDMIPVHFVGVLVAVLFIIFGHSLNFVLSLLGAFIHSARLHFIEFFDKFYEGNGKEFKPFQRAKKYLFFKR